MAKLYSEFKIKNNIIKNRIVMAPMCMYSAQDDGIANEFHFTHYTSRAIGGVGTIIIEATAVEPRGRISVNDLGLWSDKQIPELARIVKEVHQYNTFIGIQLNHAGRKAKTQEKNIAPSNILDSEFDDCNEMDIDTITKTIKLFKEAAMRAKEIGFDFIEIHGAHGYLINQFLSPLANKRTDQYGGSLENRARFLIEIVKAIREVWPKEKVLSVRFSGEEYHELGNHPEDIAKVINLIKNDIDIVNISSGGVISTSINTFPGYQLDFASSIRKKTNMITVGGGLITTAKMAEEAIENEHVDFVFFGRELLRNPYFALASAKDLGVDLEWPKQYKRAK
jgi:NADPH2 dehydrogenase